MKYNEWRDELKNNLLGVGESERARVLDYYAEAYADRREAGFSEREIIEEFGAPYDAAQRILAETPKPEDKPAQAEAATQNPPVPPAMPVANAFVPQTAVAAPAPKAKKSNKVWIIPLVVSVAVLVILLAILLPVRSACRAMRTKFEMQSYESAQEVTALNMTIAGSFRTEFYDGENVVINYPVANVYTTSLTESGGTLHYTAELKATPFWGHYNIPDAVVKLPKSKAFDITAEISAGSAYLCNGNYNDVKLTIQAGSLETGSIECAAFDADIDAGSLYAKGVKCNKLLCDVDAGGIEIERLTCNTLKANVAMGSAEIGMTGAKNEYNIKVNCDMGSTNLTSQTVPGASKTIDISVNMGSIDVSFDNRI